MAETSNQNNNPIDLREVVKIFNDRFDQMDQNYRELAKSSNDRFDKMDQNYRELAKSSNDRFDKVDQNYRELAKSSNDRFDQMDQNYRELVEFLAGEFDKIHQTKADKADTATKEDINLVLNRVAMINTKIDDYRAEQIGMQKQLDKHEKWHFAVAGKVGVKLLSK
jgi:methyl-accepting chemotaxis protein